MGTVPTTCLIFIVTMLFPAYSFADPTSVSAPPADKSRYTLFNPVPSVELRGMDTDRPNHTNTPHTIDPGHVQIETGVVDYVYNRNRYQGANARSDFWSVGQVNVRTGVLSNLELNVLFNSYDFLRQTDYAAHQTSRRNGIGDLVLGGTLNLWGDEGSDAVWASGLAVQPEFKIPAAREPLGNGHGEFFLGVPFVINLPLAFHLGLETIGSRERSAANTGEVFGWQNSASLDRVVVGKLDVYLEYWSHISTEHHLEAQQTIDLGATYPLTDNVAVDTGFNFGLNRASNDFEWTTGLSVRF